MLDVITGKVFIFFLNKKKVRRHMHRPLTTMSTIARGVKREEERRGHGGRCSHLISVLYSRRCEITGLACELYIVEKGPRGPRINISVRYKEKAVLRLIWCSQ